MSRAFALTTAILTFSTIASAQSARSTKPVWPDEGPRTWAPRPTSKDITANDLRTRLYQFADDSMSGRRIGEPGNFKGTDYIAQEFKRLGLKPAGDNGGYFQNLAFGPVGYDSMTSRLTVAGAALKGKADWIPMAPNALVGVGGRADLTNVATVYGGRWGDTTTTLDAAAMRGKVVVYSAAPSTPPRPAVVLRCDSVPDKFGAAAAAAVEAAQRAAGTAPAGRGGGGFGTRDMRAQRAGAAGVLVAGLESSPAATVSAAFNGRMTMQPAASTTEAPAGATISSSAASQIFGKPLDQLAVGATGQPVSGKWSYDWTISKTPGRNVIAIMPGSDPARAGEYVLVGAHNDHVGTNATTVDHASLRAVNTVTRRQGANDPVCRPTEAQQHRIDSLIKFARSIRAPRRDSIMNGADDDGSGTVVLLEIAEKFAHEKPARSIIFVSHEGEEAGLLGSRWFVDHPTVPLDKIVAAHNMDMEGKGHVEQVKYGGPTSLQTLGARRISREFGDIIDSVNAVRTEVMALDKSWDVTANPLNRFCRSDQVNYVNHGIPVTYFSTGYAQDYHQPTDEPQYIDYDHMAKIGRFIHDVMMAVSERKERPLVAGQDPAYPSCAR
ncbi:MAG: M28 family peptidase [Gemmatimonadaceae bacterium]